MDNFEGLLRAVVGSKRDTRVALNLGCDPNQNDDDGWTPLMLAIFYNDVCEDAAEIVKLLLEFGARVNSINVFDQTALMFACGLDVIPNPTIVKILINSGASVNIRDTSGRTPIMYASNCCYKVVVQLLLENDANVNSVDRHGWSALMFASSRYAHSPMDPYFSHAKSNKPDTVKLLLDVGANFRMKNNEGYRALDLTWGPVERLLISYINGERDARNASVALRQTRRNLKLPTDIIGEIENVLSGRRIKRKKSSTD